MSPGILTITGNYTQTGGLYIEVGRPDPGTGYDRMNVSGTVSLAGYLAVTMIDGYLPGACDDFSIITWGHPSNPLWAVQYKAGAPSPGYSYSLPFFEFWQQVRIRNTGASTVYNVMAYIARVVSNTQIIDGQVTAGTVAPGASVWSADTFRLKVNLSIPAGRCDGFTWRIEYDELPNPGDPLNVHHILTDIPQFPPGPAPGGCR